MAVLAEINKAFRLKIATITSYYCAFENESYKPKEGEPYLRSWFLPAGVRPVSIDYDDAVDDYTGLFQVNVYAPENEGTALSNTICEAVESLFKRGTVLSCAVIDRQPERGTGRNQGGWWVIPISIYYRAIT
jgi:hypothetical protein